MLDPRQRKIYLSELRPPEGYRLDKAVCTTYTLDLISLLMAPLSMALYEAQNHEQMMKDRMALLEALRRTADRIAVFCQKGRIALPGNDTPLVSLLEKAVVQVEPSDEKGVFHPKVWVLRFASEDEPVIYRVLCLSRNLTFDKSWDTVLTLEGKQTENTQAYPRNRSLSNFLFSLPEFATETANPNVRSLVEQMAEEVLTVDFKPPPDVKDFNFLPLGTGDKRARIEWGVPSRIMVVSPFLSQGQLDVLTKLGSDNVLVSRPESLDEISNEVLEEVEENCKIFIMDQDAEMPEPEESAETDELLGVELTPLTGLHAKIFIVEDGGGINLYTGSANFSDPALSGRNVEFMVELQGRKNKLGINKFLGDKDGNSFRSMLRKYHRDPALKKDRSTEGELERILDKARAAIASGGIKAYVTPAEDELFDLSVTVTGDFAGQLEGVEGSFYPISLKASSGKPINELQSGQPVEFKNVTSVALTSFFAFKIQAELKNKSAAIAFVLNLPVEGMPEDRDNRLLHHLISDQKSFIRYLLFILMEGDGALLASDIISKTAKQDNDGMARSILGFHLLEELVRAYSRNPEKIERIAKLVDDLGRTPEGRSLFPDGFEEVWQAFKTSKGIKEARQ